MRRVRFIMLASLAYPCSLAACLPAADVTPDAPPTQPPAVVYSSRVGGDDADFAADRAPVSPVPASGPLSFGAVNDAAMEAVAQGQYGTHKGKTTTVRQPDGSFQYVNFDVAVECEMLRADARAAAPGCAEELYAANCAQANGKLLPDECRKCADLAAKDDAIAAKGCPPREQYGAYRSR